jgi:hypothetical protein
MISETVLRKEGLNILSEKLGILEAEHFIAVIKREPFDYTKWRENLFPDTPAEEFLQKAADFRKQNMDKN